MFSVTSCFFYNVKRREEKERRKERKKKKVKKVKKKGKRKVKIPQDTVLRRVRMGDRVACSCVAAVCDDCVTIV